MTPNPEDRLGGTDGLDFEPVQTRPQPKRHWGRWVSFAVVVIVGAGGGWYYFGDQLPMMEQEKSVPVIRADITPVKIKPADPGGMDVPDRDKLVYDRLKGEAAGTNVERLLPPPETPIPIPESQLQGASSETDTALSEPSSETPPAPPSEPMVPETASAEQFAEPMAAAVEPSAQPDENAPVPLEPSSAIESAQEPATPDTAAPVAPPPPAPVEPVEAAPVTPTPPEPVQPATPTTQTAAETISQSQSAASATTAQTKEYRIQLAALRTHERTETEWKRQKKAHPDILGGLELYVVRVDLGGDQGVFFRLRAGPLKDAESAKTLCAELSKRNVGCLVIRPGK